MIIVAYLFIFVFAMILLLLPFISERNAVLALLIGALLFPYINVGSIFIRFEMLYIIWLTFYIILKSAFNKFHIFVNKVALIYSLYLFVVLIATSIYIFTNSVGSSLLSLLIPFFGYARPLLVIILFLNIKVDLKFVKRFLWIFIITSVIINLFSILQFLNIGTVTNITQNYFSSPGRTPIAQSIAQQGFVLRTVGVLESPVYNAIYILFVLVFITNMLKCSKGLSKLFLYFSFIVAFIAGVTTISKTFFLGTVIIFILDICNSNSIGKIFSRIARILLIAAILLSIIGLTVYPLYKGYINYEIRQILSFNILESRYDVKSGQLSGTLAAIKENPIIGYGLIEQEGTFIGDSLYTATLLASGIIGLVIFLIVVFFILNSTRMLPNSLIQLHSLRNVLFQVTVLCLFVGFGASSFTIMRIDIWYWALVGIISNKYLFTIYKTEALSNKNPDTLIMQLN